MRPQIKPALNRAWRGPGTLQLGLDPATAVVLTGLSGPAARLIAALDGRHDRRLLHLRAAQVGLAATAADRLVELLEQAAVLDDADRLPGSRLDSPARQRLAPDLATLSLLARTGDGGGDLLAARRAAWVEVRGAGRVGAQVAALLAAAGVGRVSVDDPEHVRPGDISPGGLGPGDVGSTRGRAAERAVAWHDGGARPEPAERTSGPDLVVLAPVRGLAREDAARLLAAGIPHLPALVVELTGVVGPLVLPGRSSCVRCQDLHRADRDQGWPRVLAQACADPPGEPACDLALATLTAAQASAQALAYLGGEAGAVLEGTLETTLPYGLTRRRSWRAHPACGCRWDERAPDSPTGGA